MRVCLFLAATALLASVSAQLGLTQPPYHEADVLGRWFFDKDPTAAVCPFWWAAVVSPPCPFPSPLHTYKPRTYSTVSLFPRSGRTRRGVHLNKCKEVPGWGNTTLCRGIGWSSVPGRDPVVFLDFFTGPPPPSLRGRSHNAFNGMTILTKGEVLAAAPAADTLGEGSAQWFTAGIPPV